MLTRTLRSLFIASSLTLVAAPVVAEPIYGITDSVFTTSSLVLFDSATPNLLTTVATITGLAAGQTLRGIDFRASDRQLYAVSSTATAAQLYTVNLATGALTAIGSGFALTGNSSTHLSIDFNPVANALRVVTGSGQSYRVNANTGALIAQDTSITPTQLLSSVAYTNNVVGATSTTLYAYSFTNDTVGTIGSVGGTPSSPNAGVYMTVGRSGITTASDATGFDISGLTGVGYLSADNLATQNANSEFYTVNLATGLLSFVGNFNTALLDISVAIAAPAAVPEPEVFGLLAAGLLGFGLARRRRSIR